MGGTSGGGGSSTSTTTANIAPELHPLFQQTGQLLQGAQIFQPQIQSPGFGFGLAPQVGGGFDPNQFNAPGAQPTPTQTQAAIPSQGQAPPQGKGGGQPVQPGVPAGGVLPSQTQIPQGPQGGKGGGAGAAPEAGAGLLLSIFTIYQAYFHRLHDLVERVAPVRTRTENGT